MPYSTSNPPPASIKAIAIIHAALVAGPVLFACVTFGLKKSLAVDLDMEDPYLLLVPAIAFMSVLASALIFPKLLDAARNKGTFPEKMMAYQSALIVRFALVEAPSLFSIVVYFVTGNALYLLIAIALIGYFISVRPTKEKAIADLQLNWEEQANVE